MPQINVGPQTSLGICPYVAWRHYFPMEDYDAHSERAKEIKVRFYLNKVLLLTLLLNLIYSG